MSCDRCDGYAVKSQQGINIRHLDNEIKLCKRCSTLILVTIGSILMRDNRSIYEHLQFTPQPDTRLEDWVEIHEG
jgi:hypothetical protein